MRRAWITGIALSLILSTQSSLATPNSSPAKAGTSCNKLSQTQIVNSVKYTCIKSGKKLIWDKGAKVVAPKPSGTSSQNSSSSPNQIPSKSSESSSSAIGPKPGDICQNIGSHIPKGQGVYLECRTVAQNNLKWFELNQNPSVPVNDLNLGNIKDCQVPDQTGREPGATPIGYKSNRVQNPTFPTEGKFTIVIAPIDFSDFPGEKLDTKFLDANARNIEKWFSYESNGKLSVDVVVIDHWLRAPKISQKYNWNHPGTINPTNLTDNELGQDFVDLIDPYVNFSKVGAIFVLHPADIKSIEYGMMASIRVNSNEGQISPFLVSTGFQSMRQNGALWALWVHELMHHLGMTGHAPSELMFLDLMDLQSGMGLATTTWNQFLIDWLPASQIYCRKIDEVKKEAITLTSVDSLSLGIKSIMVTMSNHEVLVIESRRKDYWTTSSTSLSPKEVFDGFYGVTVYLVDTTKDNDRSVNFKDPTFDPTKYRFAYYLKINSSRPDEFKGVESLNYLMLLNESLTFRNLRISLVKSGDFDTVQIEKV